MHRFAFLSVVFALIGSTYPLGLNKIEDDDTIDEERLIIIPTNFNLSAIDPTLVYLLALGSALLSLLGVAALAAVLFGLLGKYKYHDDYYGGGYGHSGYGGSSYQTYRSAFDPSAIDWESFSILEWISVGQEVWEKFEPSNLDCQKRLICELHQSTDKLGSAAAKIVDIFSYLSYAKVMRLPEEASLLIDDLLEAADRGKTMIKDCGEVYDGCDFSVKKIAEKIGSPNDI